MNSVSQMFTNKNIGILGFGREGKSIYTFLIKHDISPTQIVIYDERAHIAELPVGVATHLGPFSADKLLKHDSIFVSPWLTLHMLAEKIWRENLALLTPKLTSQTQYFFDQYKWMVIWVTGTKGKSTISTLIYLMLKEAGKQVQLVGNIGKPVLDEIDLTNPPEIVVYELSSFMLEKLNKAHIHIGIINTLYPAHTKEHGSHDDYVAAKLKVLKMSDTALIGTQAAEIIDTKKIPQNSFFYGKTGKWTFHDGQFFESDKQLFTDQDILLLGEHNRHNICAVIGVCQSLNIDLVHLQTVLKTFTGLEHRIEHVGTYGWIDRYNDAIATTPQATIAAIETFKDELETIFLGGSEGNYEFSWVTALLEKYHIKNVILFPDTWPRIKELLDNTKYNIFETRSMQEAVQRAAQVTGKNKVALLSCGSPSFSLRSSYTEKGRLFKEAVRELGSVPNK